MDKNIAWRAFSKYLYDKGYSDESKSGNKSTNYDYPSRVERIYKRENLKSFDELGEHITEILNKYDKNGSEAEYGAQSNGSNITALKFFKEFYFDFDKRRHDKKVNEEAVM